MKPKHVIVKEVANTKWADVSLEKLEQIANILTKNKELKKVIVPNFLRTTVADTYFPLEVTYYMDDKGKMIIDEILAGYIVLTDLFDEDTTHNLLYAITFQSLPVVTMEYKHDSM